MGGRGAAAKDDKSTVRKPRKVARPIEKIVRKVRKARVKPAA